MSNEQALAALAGLALIGLLTLVSSGRTKTGQRAGRMGRAGGYALRTLVGAGVIVGVQWAVVALVEDPRVIVVVLAVPALLAGTTVARLLADRPEVVQLRGGHR